PYLERLDSLGSTLWRHTYDSLPTGGNGAFGVTQTADGGYVFVTYGGYSVSTVVVVKTDSLGEAQWTYADDAESPHWLFGGDCPTTDGGCAVAGFCRSDSIFLLKLDSSGNRQWLRRYPDTRSRDWSISAVPVAQTGDGGFIVGTDRLLKTDVQGNQVWRTAYDSVYAIFDVHEVSGGGYAAVGVGGKKRAGRGHDRYKLCLLKVTSAGALQWRRLYAYGEDGAMGISVDVTADGGYFVSGEDGTGMVARYDTLGVELWRLTELNSVYWASYCQQTSDGGYVVSAHNKIIRLAPEGD
ncbi:MAG: hypothetical protein JXA67_20770, partial [Micromonosporaceae bacterium]|nr:hypothetical protein [Micromonosporaceae bacterium]